MGGPSKGVLVPGHLPSDPMCFDSQMMLWGDCDQNTKAMCSVHMMSIPVFW